MMPGRSSLNISRLTLDLLLQVLLDDGDAVKGGAHFDAFERIVLEDERDAFCLGDDEHDDGAELDRG